MNNWIDYRSTRPCQFSRDNIEAFPEEAVLSLSAAEQLALREQSLAIAANPYDTKEQELFITAARQLTNSFADTSRDFVHQQLENGFGAVLIKGLPIDEMLPVTPSTGGSLPVSYKNTFVSEAMLMALGGLTNAEPFNFRQEGRGTAPLIDNIVPIPSLKTQRGAGGFANNFPFHCESAWHRKRPDYLILLGIREAPDARTLVFSTQMLEHSKWQECSKDVKEWFRLKAPDLYTQMEHAGIPMGTGQYSFEPPIATGDGKMRLNINFNGTECIHEEAVQWLAELEDFVESKTVGAVIAEGNALILNNHLTCHTRTGYTPSFNGLDRWFLRGYFKKDLWAKEQLPDRHDDIYKDLVEQGWITEEGQLTSSFLKYVYQPEETKKLTGKQAALASLAFHYTPVTGSRIV